MDIDLTASAVAPDEHRGAWNSFLDRVSDCGALLALSSPKDQATKLPETTFEVENVAVYVADQAVFHNIKNIGHGQWSLVKWPPKRFVSHAVV